MVDCEETAMALSRAVKNSTRPAWRLNVLLLVDTKKTTAERTIANTAEAVIERAEANTDGHMIDEDGFPRPPRRAPGLSADEATLVNMSRFIMHNCPFLEIRGLTLERAGPYDEDEAKKDFDALHYLRHVTAQGIGLKPTSLELIMGSDNVSSNDFEFALLRGSTGVKIGANIFGELPQEGTAEMEEYRAHLRDLAVPDDEWNMRHEVATSADDKDGNGQTDASDDENSDRPSPPKRPPKWPEGEKPPFNPRKDSHPKYLMGNLFVSTDLALSPLGQQQSTIILQPVMGSFHTQLPQFSKGAAIAASASASGLTPFQSTESAYSTSHSTTLSNGGQNPLIQKRPARIVAFYYIPTAGSNVAVSYEETAVQKSSPVTETAALNHLLRRTLSAPERSSSRKSGTAATTPGYHYYCYHEHHTAHIQRTWASHYALSYESLGIKISPVAAVSVVHNTLLAQHFLITAVSLVAAATAFGAALVAVARNKNAAMHRRKRRDEMK